MPRNPEQDRSTVIAQALSRGMTTSQISGVMGVSKRTVTRVSSNLKKHGSPKAPPSGAKQGRPAKVTRSQAQALLSWITAKEYVFYVKDLVKFLKSDHGYKGCDGTIRRALIRAGFRRKEPFRKSEMTHWVPPDHPVNFVVITEDNGDDHNVPADADDDADDGDGPTTQQSAQDAVTAVQQPDLTTTDPMQILSAQAVSPFVQGMDPVNVAQLQAASHMQLDPQHNQDFRLDPALRAMQPQLAPAAEDPLQRAQQPEGAHNAPLQHSIQSAVATLPQTQSNLASAKKKKQQSLQQPSRADDTLRQQVDTLQSQLAQQTELIKHLQSQLMQSQNTPMQQQMAGPSAAQFTTPDRP